MQVAVQMDPMEAHVMVSHVRRRASGHGGAEGVQVVAPSLLVLLRPGFQLGQHLPDGS
jgi:hypothetical protein